MISSESISDLETGLVMERVYNDHGYMLDPHGAVAFAALERYLERNPGKKGIILETAHPVKFPESVEKHTGESIAWPEQVERIRHKTRRSVKIEPDYEAVRQFLLSAYLEA
jgi:threonine synthase